MTKLTDFANTLDQEYVFLQEQVLDKAARGGSYKLDVELPKGCTPRFATLQVGYMEGAFWLELLQTVKCPKIFGKLYQLAALTCMHFADFEELKRFMRDICLRGGDADTNSLPIYEYITKDRSLNLHFEFHEISKNNWRIYILSNINYGSRSDSSANAHWLYDTSHNCRYICWNNSLRSLADAKTVASVWSEVTAYYIRHGGNFSDIARILGFA